MYAGSFVFPYEAENCPFKMCEELCWIFNGNCIDLEIAAETSFEM